VHDTKRKKLNLTACLPSRKSGQTGTILSGGGTRSGMAETIARIKQGTSLASTSEILRRLRQLRSDLNQRLVITWLRDRQESPQDIADAVALMAEVADMLYGEIDLFIGSIDLGEGGEPGRPEPDVELVDLQAESEAELPLDRFLS
jgi:hypothetical protein